MKEIWKVFKLNGKTLGGYTLEGTFEGEEEATKKLFANENNCNISDIAVEIEVKGAEE